MASATTADSNAADSDLPLQLDSIPTVDLNLISQSELYTLSLCSSSTFNPRRCDDLVIPKFDRSVFNESAGSRKQTYSRLRLAPATSPNSPSALRRRGPVLRTTNFNAPPLYLDSDPEVAESRQIVHLLKQLFGVEDISVSSNDDGAEVGNQLVPVRVDYFDTMPQISNAGSSVLKRKRGRPSKHENALALGEHRVENLGENNSMTMNDTVIHHNVEEENNLFANRDTGDLLDDKVETRCEGSNVVRMVTSMKVVKENVEDRDKEMINRDGVVVDLVGLGFMEDPYAAELGRRTEGMSREEELLAFLSALNGEWVSRRKKRRIVDASEFGNVLPKGWRLMLACRKKDGRIWIFCRRYLSPNGRQFVSCKEISAYLLSLNGTEDSSQLTCPQHILDIGQNNVNVQAADKFIVTNASVLAVSNETKEENDVSRFLSQAFASMSGDYVGKVNTDAGDQTVVHAGSSLGHVNMEAHDQPVVHVGNSLNCDKCDLTFNYQDDLLHHKMSSHPRKRLKPSVTDGVIIKDGKYECQFCHKTFVERKRYNGHMGSHVRKQGKAFDESQAANDKEAAGTVPVDLISYRDSVVQTVTDTESSVASYVMGQGAGDQPNSDLPHGGIDRRAGNTEAFGDENKVDDPMDVEDLETNEALEFEADFSKSEKKHNGEIPGCASLSNEAPDGSQNSSAEQEKMSKGSPLPSDKQTEDCLTNGVADGSVNFSNEQKKISEGCSSLRFDEKTGAFVRNEGVDVSGTCAIEQESKVCSPLALNEQTGCCTEADGSGKYNGEEERISEGCSPLQLDKQTGGFDDMINGLFESNRETISGSALHGSNENLDSCDIDWDSGDFSHPMDELRLDGNKIMDDDPALGFCDKSGLDGSAVGEKLHTGFKEASCSDLNFVKDKSISMDKVCEQNLDYETNSLTNSSGKDIENGKDVYGLFTGSSLVVEDHDKMHNYGIKEHPRSAEFSRDAIHSLEKDRGATVTEKRYSEHPNGDLGGQNQSGPSKGPLTSLSSFGGSFPMNEHIDKVSSRMIPKHHMNNDQMNNDSHLGFPFRSNSNHPIIQAEDKDKTKFGFRSFFPSENRKVFSADDNRVSLQSCAVEDSNSRLLAQSRGMQSPHEAYGANKIFSPQINEHGSTVTKNSKSQGLCLAFDSQASSSVNQLEQYGAKSFGIHPGMDQTYGVPRDVNNFGLGVAANAMEGRGFGIDLHNSSFSDKSKYENNFDQSYSGRIWDGARVQETVNSDKFMVDFDNSNPQPSGDVMTGGIWQTGQGNMLQPHVTGTASPLVQSSNNFHTFGIISEKGPGGLFGVDQKYNSGGGFEGLTLGRSQPTEYSFFATQNSNSLPVESKSFSYNVGTQPGYDSSYWLGKEAMMTNMPVQNRVPTVCVWCRSEFFEEAMSSAAQTGAIGSICPTCRSGIPQQFNVL